MEKIQDILKEDIKNLVEITKEEKDNQSNNDQLPEVYKSYPITLLTQYLNQIKEDFYDVDKITNLMDDIRYYEITNPVIERLHVNLETSLHNKSLHNIKEKSQVFKDMMKDYYIVRDVECDLIDRFLELLQQHIDASKKTASLNYLAILGIIRENIEFKYTSNVETYNIVLPISEQELYDKRNLYIENMIIRCMYEFSNFSNEDLLKDNIYAKANALAIYLQTALSLVQNKKYIDEYQLISNDIPMGTTARGIINTAFIQQKAIEKKLTRDDKDGN